MGPASSVAVPTMVRNIAPAPTPPAHSFAHLHCHDSYRKRVGQLELGRAHKAKSSFLKEICESLVSTSGVRHGD